MSINYDCVAIWVGNAGRDYLLQILEEQYGYKGATEQPHYRNAKALFVYKNRSTLYHSREVETYPDLCKYMSDKRCRNEVGSYLIIDYPELVKECREWTYDY